MWTRTQYTIRDVKKREPADKNAEKHLLAVIDYQKKKKTCVKTLAEERRRL